MLLPDVAKSVAKLCLPGRIGLTRRVPTYRLARRLILLPSEALGEADPTALLFHPDLIIRQSTGPVRPADPPIDSWLALPTPRA